jgi:hypothetical protein
MGKMKPTDKAVCLDVDGNRIAILPGHLGMTFAEIFSADSKIARIVVHGRDGLPKGRICRSV